MFSPGILQLALLLHPKKLKAIRLETAEGRKDAALDIIEKSLQVSRVEAEVLLRLVCRAFDIKLPEG